MKYIPKNCVEFWSNQGKNPYSTELYTLCATTTIPPEYFHDYEDWIEYENMSLHMYKGYGKYHEKTND